MDKALKDKIEELFKATPSNVGVAYGTKRVNGKFTGENCIVFNVEKKKPLSELSKDEILPTSVKVGENVYKTDVWEVGKIRTFAVSCYPAIAGSCVDCNPIISPACYIDWCPPNYDPEAGIGSLPIPNQGYIIPLKGGVQITSDHQWPALDGNYYTGTLGFIAIDTLSSALVGVTNNHVVVANPFYTTERAVDNVQNEENDTVYLIDTYTHLGYYTPYTIGKVIRYVPVKHCNPVYDIYGELIDCIGPINLVDGALISVDSSVIDSESHKQYGLSYTGVVEFASPEDIESLTIYTPIYSSGKTTGPKEDYPCNLRVVGIHSYAPVSGYNDGYVPRLVNYGDLIHFERIDHECPWPIAPGDSGSALIANFSGTWKIIGLCFAGNEFNGFACSIYNVESELGISRWDGTSHPTVNTLTGQHLITISGTTDSITTICGGNTYWQIGAKVYSNPC